MADLYKTNPIYKTIELFCTIKGFSISAMCKEAGISPGLVTDLKMGRKQTIQIETASKIASALNTDVNTLMGNKLNKSYWDLDTCFKWMNSDSKEDRIFILEEYGVDLEFLLDNNYPDRKKELSEIVFNQASTAKEKSPAPEGDGLDPETIELRDFWGGADKEEREVLLSMARMLKSRRVGNEP